MRLVCPNCDAQYELAEGAIADAGRDVQCSNCGHAWFQLPLDLEAEREAEEELFGKSAPVPRPPVSGPNAAKAAPTVERSESPKTASPKTASIETQDAVDAAALAAALGDDVSTPPKAETKPAERPALAASDQPAADEPPLPPIAQRRALDEGLKAVLREEAEREAAVRRSQTPRPLETQADLGLQETSGAAKAVRDRLARLRGQDPAPEANDKPTARRDLLPDIEEINSTLRASSENRGGDEAAMAANDATAATSNTGFRSGFSLMLLIAVVLITAYVAAPKIIEQFPAVENAMTSYVAGVDAARAWLDSAMRNAIAALQNLTGGVKK